MDFKNGTAAWFEQLATNLLRDAIFPPLVMRRGLENLPGTIIQVKFAVLREIFLYIIITSF